MRARTTPLPSVVAILLLLSLVGRPACGEPQSAKRYGTAPNVVMICVDDLNDWVGVLGGHPQAKTPHMDRLAKRGRVFANAHCSVPVCSASRVSILSGLSPTTHGSYQLGPAYTTIPRLKNAPTLHGYFKRHGYTTLTGGKVLHGRFSGKLANDIDRTLSTRRGGPKPRRPLHWTPQVWDWGEFPEHTDEMYDFQLATSAAKALQEDFSQPFFMSVGFFRPHVPMYAPPEWFQLFDADSIVLPNAPADDMDDVPNNFHPIIQIGPTHRQVTAAKCWRKMVHAYLASSAFADHCVGVVLDALQASKHQSNTIVVLWSDHGFHLGEKQHWAKRTLWEESTRVPLIIAGPEVESGAPCGEPVSLLDIYPTLIELCGLPRKGIQLDGVSLLPQLQDPTARRKRPALTSSYEGNHAVRTRDWRYIRYADGAEELYDHRRDPEEHRNLAAIEEFSAKKQELAAHIPRHAAAEVIPLAARTKRRQQLKERQKNNGPIAKGPAAKGASTSPASR